MNDELPSIARNFAPKKKAFLAAYCEAANITLAADAAQVSRRSHYNWLHTDPEYCRVFAECREIAASVLEDEAVRRAKDGVQKLKFHQGEMICIPARDTEGKQIVDVDGKPVMVPYVEHDYSDVLLIFLLKGLMPEKYRERYEHTLSDKSDDHLEVYGKTKKQLRDEALERVEAIRRRLEHG